VDQLFVIPARGKDKAKAEAKAKENEREEAEAIVKQFTEKKKLHLNSFSRLHCLDQSIKFINYFPIAYC